MMSIWENNGCYPDSYYAASAHAKPERRALDTANSANSTNNITEADVVIVGGGFSGLSAGIHLAESGRQVMLLEAAQIGWGASGRNGGLMLDGYSKDLSVIEKKYGNQRAAVFAEHFHRGGEIIRRLVADYGIDCDLKYRTITTAFTPKQLRELALSADEDGCEMLDKTALREHIGTDAYLGGLLEHYNGHLHPLNLALGEAAAFEQLGGTIYENTVVDHIKPDNNGVTVITKSNTENTTKDNTENTTKNGEIRCQQVLLCGNAYLNKVIPELTDRVMPVSSQLIATEPLGDLAAEILPTDVGVCDMRYILDYYRLSADKRLLFGGGTVYGGGKPAHIERKIRANMEKIFPQLKGIGIDYAWSGNFALSFSRVPQLGQLHKRVLFTHGYSGHGVTVAHLFGSVLADATNGKTDTFERFKAMPWLPFPGGRTFCVPYSTAGAWWYSMRDKLGI